MKRVTLLTDAGDTVTDNLTLTEALDMAIADRDDDLNDADVYPLISDHDPEHTITDNFAQLRRDGQRWAAGLTEHRKHLAFAIAIELDRDLNPERRAFCEGVKVGLEQGYRGLVADNGDA